MGTLLFGVIGLAHAQSSDCGSLANHYGPFDYRKATKGQLSIVEEAHFTPYIENLIKRRDNPFGDDIAYTLRVFPNHHRALLTIQTLAEREKTDSPSYARLSVACYFERAIRFQPDDIIVRMLYASYLIKKARQDEASQQLEEAIKLAGDSPFSHFNIGLIFLEMKNYERALTQAHRAAALGFTRTELKDQLVAAGKWVEPAVPFGARE
jgi:tetratricopeptide (TPR) repeat protein